MKKVSRVTFPIVRLVSGIQIRKNLFGIKSRFLEHMKSYDYKFKSLGKCRNIKVYFTACADASYL